MGLNDNRKIDKVVGKIRKKRLDFSYWKDNCFDPWYKYTFKPKVNVAKKDLKRNVKNILKSYRKRKNERLKRKYSRSDNYNINIRNIENIENFAVGSKNQKRFEALPQNYQLPLHNRTSSEINYKKHCYPSKFTNRLAYQPESQQKTNLELEKLSNWYEEIKSLNELGYYPELITKSKEFIEYFLSRLAEYLNISYRSADEFLYYVNEKGYRFQFYDEIRDYNRYLTIGTPKIGESAYWIYEIISKIMNKVYKIAGSTR